MEEDGDGASLLHLGVVEDWARVMAGEEDIAVGTQAEALWVAAKLRTQGEDAELVRVNGSDGIVAVAAR